MSDREFLIPLPGGGAFRFSAPFPVSVEQWRHISDVLEVMRPGLVEERPATADDTRQGGEGDE